MIDHNKKSSKNCAKIKHCSIVYKSSAVVVMEIDISAHHSFPDLIAIRYNISLVRLIVIQL